MDDQTSLPFGSALGPKSSRELRAHRRPDMPIKVGGPSPLRYVSYEGYSFLQPTLGRDGIEVTDFLYVWVDDDEVRGWRGPNDETLSTDARYVRVQAVEDYFEVPSHAPKLKTIGSADLVRQVPATLTNLERLIALPLVDSHSVAKAISLLIKWRMTVPAACFTSIMLKNSTERRFPE